MPPPNKVKRWRVLLLPGILLVLLYIVGLWFRFSETAFLDFPSFWLAAKLTFDLNMFPYGAPFTEGAENLVDRYVHPFIYPPLTLPFLWPLSLIDLEASAEVFLLVNAVLAVASGVFALLIAAHDWRARPRLAVAFLVILIFMVAQSTRITFGHGQLNLVVLAAALGSWVLLDGSWRQEILAGILLTIAVALKLYAIGLLAALVLGRRWWALASVAVGLSLAATFVALALPSGLWREWVHHVLASGDSMTFAGKFDLASSANISVTGILLRLDSALDGGIGELVLILRIAFPIVLIMVTLAATLRHRNNGASLAEVGAYLALISLIPTNVWVHYAIFALPAAVAAFLEAYRRCDLVLGCLAACAIAMLLQNPLPVVVKLFGLPSAVASFGLTAVLLLTWALAIFVTVTSARNR